MKKRYVKIIIGIFLVIIILFGGYSYWASKNKTILSYTTPEGEEKSVVIPAIPGVDKQGEVVTECSKRVDYDIKISQVPPLEASPQIKEIIKPRMEAEGWVVKEEMKVEGYWVIIFERDEEKLTATTGAKGDLPVVELLYEWPPCSEE
ncbi:MAG: hypothetical protein KKH52_00090 [Nanoarchaeota archaeon]|nr:hypothetical protein [Nanoarchaeota archaeon]MBU1622757.1 hypothetical protein [Nanoarchaeota archaeon]MBU1973775.1 hypothetical protein [Nanoarchaeota archaeon]